MHIDEYLAKFSDELAYVGVSRVRVRVCDVHVPGTTHTRGLCMHLHTYIFRCVCMCMDVNTRARTHTHTHTYIHKHISISQRDSLHGYVHTNVQRCVLTYACRANIQAPMHMRIHEANVCTRTCA